MLDRGHHLVFRGAVAGQLVRDHHARGPALLFQQLAEQALGGLFVPPALDENVGHDPILVDGPPEPVLLAADHQAHFVEVPLVARAWQPTPDLVGETLAELARPLPHGLVAHVDAAGGQHLFDHAQAQRKAEVEPDGVADDLARKAVAGVGGLGAGCHAGHLPVPALPAQPRPKLTVPSATSGSEAHMPPACSTRGKRQNFATAPASLRQRGRLTVWFTDEATRAWRAEPRTTRGGQPWYSELAILTALTLRAVFRLA